MMLLGKKEDRYVYAELGAVALGGEFGRMEEQLEKRTYLVTSDIPGAYAIVFVDTTTEPHQVEFIRDPFEILSYRY